MTVYRYADSAFSRKVVSLGKAGITIKNQRSKVGGGWYTANQITAPWPWIN